jgi:hypothetical protein
VPLTLEHLDYLPPVGRWHNAVLVDCEDGETELELYGRPLPQREWTGPDTSDLVQGAAVVARTTVSAASMKLSFESRNFEPEVLEELRRTAPIPLSEEEKWAVLPPLIFALCVVVTWGAAKFVGAFFEELGRGTAQSFAAWLKRTWNSAREPERDRILAVRFELEEGRFISAFVIVPYDSPDPEKLIEVALGKLGDIASVAGMQREQATFPGLWRGAYIFDQGTWRLAWWTDGTEVFRSRWFEDNLPNPERFLGRPLLVDIPPPLPPTGGQAVN